MYAMGTMRNTGSPSGDRGVDQRSTGNSRETGRAVWDGGEEIRDSLKFHLDLDGVGKDATLMRLSAYKLATGANNIRCGRHGLVHFVELYTPTNSFSPPFALAIVGSDGFVLQGHPRRLIWV